MNWPWSELGLPGPADLAAVRHAYAERLKTTHPEEDPEGFQRLNEAYQQARRLARKGGGAAPQTTPHTGGEPLETEREERRSEADQPAWKKYGEVFESEAARRAEERERMAQERRAAFFRRHAPATPEEAERLGWHWARIEAAQTMAEVLLDNDASFRDWVDFLHSSVFLIVKGDPDFVAGFEAFLRQATRLPQDVKQEMVRVFSGMDANQIPQIWHGIHRILTGCAPLVVTTVVERKPLWKRTSFRIAAAIVLALILAPLAVGGVTYLVTIWRSPCGAARTPLRRWATSLPSCRGRAGIRPCRRSANCCWSTGPLTT